MEQRTDDLTAILADVRRRWSRRTRLASWSVGAAAAATVIGVGLLAVWLVAAEGLALTVVSVAVALLALVTMVSAAWPLDRPTDLQVARYVEERSGGLDDIVVTAVTHQDRPTAIGAKLSTDAASAIARVGVDRIVSRASLRRAAIRAASATAGLAVAFVLFAPSLQRGVSIATAYLVPSRLLIDVTPGSSKVRAGQAVTIRARLRGLDRGLVPALQTGGAETAREWRMAPTGVDGEFAVTFEGVSQSFDYRVSAGRAHSAAYRIEVIRPARVRRIDVTYGYPAALGLEPRTEEDGGDIYGPAGTVVDLVVTTDKPIEQGALTMADGSTQALTGSDRELTARLSIRADGSYRVALTDVDGLQNPGDTEYFIRVLDDRPPDVRMVRPGGDKEVTPLEEVLVEARADDDFGLAAFELVFQVPGRKEMVVPIPTGRQLAVSGTHLVRLEEMGVDAGAFVTYYARARDVGQGRRATESRSDIFFLEVKPFEEVFVAAQSQAMSMQGGGSDLQELAEAQKEIIAATWKLDARARRARDARSAADVRAVAKAQAALRARAAESAGQVAAALGSPGRRRPRPGVSTAPGGDDPMTRAIEAMGRAVGELERLATADALPHEMEALEQLLKADADVQRRQVSRQQQAGGGGSNRQTPDMSTLFDQQLRKQQQTNYETPNNAETREERDPQEDPLARVRELARRQEALQKAERDLARNRNQMSEEDIRRQLERLTREQNELSRQADELSRQLQQQSQQRASSEPSEAQAAQQQGRTSSQASSSSGGQSQQGGSQSQSASRSRQMREIAERMRNATSELRRQDPEQASARSAEAVEQLRDLSRQLERARPEERRRALGDLQFEARQLADAERRLSGESERTAPGPGGDDARRRLASDQERLADRTERLREAARQLAGESGEASDAEADRARHAAAEAAGDIERQRLAERMRESAGAMRQPDNGPGRFSPDQGRELARALDRVASQLGAAIGSGDGESERLSEQLARTAELREQVDELERALQALDREARQGQQGGSPTSDRQGERRSQGQASASSPNGSGTEAREATGEQGGADGGRASRLSTLQRDVVDRLRDAQRLAGELREQHSEMREGPQTPEEWWPSLSAPGTEEFKQDFSRWESLKKNLMVALDRTETRLSGQLRERQARERLNAGGHQGVSDAYREMVDRYYQSLATPRRLPR